MDAIRATAATAAPIATSASTAATTGTTTTSDASKTAAKKSFSTLFSEAKADLKKGESLTKVTGHEFGRIKGGTRDDQCVNLSGNDRNGEVFDLIWRDGRQFHVYGGKGADHKVVEVGKKAATTTTDNTTSATTGTDTTSSSSGTASTGTTGTDTTATTGGTSTTGTTTTSSGTSTSKS